MNQIHENINSKGLETRTKQYDDHIFGPKRGELSGEMREIA
jgi:hypothetical protein